MSFYVVTDIGCDLPIEYIEKQEKFLVMPIPYQMEGEERFYKAGDEKNVHAFFQKLKDGEMATTAQINVDTYYRTFKNLTDKGEGVLCFPLSSGISGSIQSAQMAAKMLLEENPEAKVRVVDSLAASMGQGLLAHYVLKQRDSGKTLEETAQWMEENRLRIIHWFTVDDLNFLYRGGRVTRTSALMGSVLRIKPVLHVNEEGKLIVREKVQGRKKSLRTLAEKVIELASPKAGQTVFISHGDCEEDARLVADMVQKGTGITDFLISPIGCVIGAHSGPGTLAIFFLGDER